MLRLICRAAAVSLLLLAGCATPDRHFRPLEKSFAESRTGHPAAEYQVVVGGKHWCELRVWSEGARAHPRDGQKLSELRIGFEIETALEDPLELDMTETQIEAVDLGDRQLDAVKGKALGPPLRSGAGNVWRIDVAFELPGVVPRDVRAFRLHWVLRGPGGARFEQYTDFVADVPRPYPYPYWDPYGPYWRPYGYGPYWRLGVGYVW